MKEEDREKDVLEYGHTHIMHTPHAHYTLHRMTTPPFSLVSCLVSHLSAAPLDIIAAAPRNTFDTSFITYDKPFNSVYLGETGEDTRPREVGEEMRNEK